MKEFDMQFKVDMYLREGKPEKAFELHKKLAESTDDVDIMVNMAKFYENGIGTPRNYVQAAYWYKQSIGSWWVISPYKLGYFYENGLGVEENIEEAILYYALSINRGSDAAGYDESYEALERLSGYYPLARQALSNRGWLYRDGQRLLPHGIYL